MERKLETRRAFGPEDVGGLVDPKNEATLLALTLGYLAGSTGDAAEELAKKLDGLSDEERTVLIAYLSKPTTKGE
jgi:hypothetical protein